MSKRRNHNAAFKARVALELLKGERTVTFPRPKHCIPPLHRRRQGFPSRSFRTT